MHPLPALLRYLKWQFTLPREEEETKTLEEVREGIEFKGYNLWILSIAMVIASIGLNVDSMSAIIGAMLISPLMGPAIGFAFGMAIGDAPLQRMCFRNWLLMTTTSLLAATLFFLISPFDHDTSSLALFKEATIFDICIAFFGGLAGFLGLIKREGTKIIAGVAVATACMPPLCTASYGIAHANAAYFVGGLYFYLINTLFIGLATYLLARYLHFRPVTTAAPNRRVRLLWQGLLVLMLLPGLYIARRQYDRQHAPRASSVSPDKERLSRLEARLDSLLQHSPRPVP